MTSSPFDRTTPLPGSPPAVGSEYNREIFQIHKEMHARVAEPVTAPCRVRHSAYLLPGRVQEAEADVRRHFEDIARGMEIEPQAIRWSERSGRVAKTLSSGHSLIIVWELHTEFYSYTTYHMTGAAKGPDAPMEAFTFPVMPSLGTKVVDLDILVFPGLKMGDALPTFLHTGSVFGGEVLSGEARVWSTFQVDGNGQGRYVIGSGRLPPGRVGRLIRRLVEIENYYHLILLPLEEYRVQLPALREIELRLAGRSEDIAADLASQDHDPDREHRWLVYLTRDLSELIRLTERMRYRLFAANSYHAILTERQHWLREQTGEGYPSMEEFLTARINPAIRNYRNFIERADVLTAQLTSLGNMMRTRVSLNMEAQSLETMQAMNRRVELQLVLQRTVEGLSLIVLSYYMTGLASYVLKAVAKFVTLPGGTALWTAATIPVWLGIAWLFTRRIKKMVHDLGEKQKGKNSATEGPSDGAPDGRET